MTDRRLVPLSGESVDDIDLELLLVGAVDDPAAQERIQDAASGPLAEVWSELQESRLGWTGSAATLLAAAPRGVVAGRRRAGPWLALAAALLLALVGVWRAGVEPDGGLRSMGGLPVELRVWRGGEDVAPGAADFLPGDRLSLSLVPPGPGYLTVALVQDDGHVTVLWTGPEEGALEPGRPFRLDRAIELDAYGGREWLVVTAHERRPHAQREMARLESALSAEDWPRGAGSWIFEVTRR